MICIIKERLKNMTVKRHGVDVFYKIKKKISSVWYFLNVYEISQTRVSDRVKSPQTSVARSETY
jgi:hypothetical protein